MTEVQLARANLWMWSAVDPELAQLYIQHGKFQDFEIAEWEQA